MTMHHSQRSTARNSQRSTARNFVRRGLGLMAMLGLLVATTHSAKTDEATVDVSKEFLSTEESIKEAAQRGSPIAVWETLEHGERVECLNCISYVEPLLYDADARVRMGRDR